MQPTVRLGAPMRARRTASRPGRALRWGRLAALAGSLAWGTGAMGASLWTPASPGAPGMGVWFDAADSSTLTLNPSNSAQVTGWRDKSGNNRNATADPSYAPSVVTLNGRSALDFGALQYSQTNPHMFYPEVQVSTVFKVWGSQAGGGFLMTNRYNYSWHRGPGNPDESDYRAVMLEAPNSYSEPGLRTGDAITRLNGAVVDPTTTGLSGNWDIVAMRANTGNTYPSDTISEDRTYRTGGQGVAEIIVMTSRPSECDVQRIEGYLAWKWGLQGKLPSNHAFKNRAPTENLLCNGGFEAGATANGDFTYRASDQAPWVLADGSGITSAGSGYTSNNSGPPEGRLAAYIQNHGSLSQTFNVPAAGSYAVYFRTVNRAQNDLQVLQVTIDGTVLFTQELPHDPFPSTWMYVATPPIMLGTGSHTIQFTGISNVYDGTGFIDDVSVLLATPVNNTQLLGSFEEWQVGYQNYQVNPGAQPWTFANAGLVANGSGLGNADAPQGTQAAFVKSGGSMSQTWTDPGGSYRLSFSAASRPSTGTPTLTLTIDGNAAGTWTLSSGTYAALQANVTLAAGSHTVVFASSSGDSFVDNAQLAAAPATLLAQYRFEEASWSGSAGELKDSSGNANHGKAIGSPRPAPADMSPARTGTPGTCGYATLPASGNNTGAFEVTGLGVSLNAGDKTSVSFWMYWDGTDTEIPIGWKNYALLLKGSSIGFNTANGDVWGTSSTGLANGWHHIAAVFQNGAVTSNEIWIDGVSKTLSQQGSNVANNGLAYVASTLRLGGWSEDNAGGFSRFSGRLDEVKVYTGGMSPAQVAADYAATHTCGGTPAVLVAELRLDEASWNGTAGEAVDSSGNGHPGAALSGTAPTSGSSVPAAAGNPGTCSYATMSSSAFAVPSLPVSTAANDQTSVSFWMYWNGTDQVIPIGWQQQTLYLNGGKFGFDTLGGNIYGSSSSGLANGWHHIVAVFTNGNYSANRLYIDGNQQSLALYYGTPNDAQTYVSSTMYIGDWGTSTNNRFSGYLDEVRIYSGAMTATQVTAAMNASHACAGAAPGSFNAFESTTAAGAVTGVLHTKVSGSAFGIDVVALDASRSSVLSSFTGTVKVEILNAVDNSGALDANGCRSSWVAVPSGAFANLTFAGADAGRKAVTLTEAEAWRDLRLRITTPATGTAVTRACSSDDFALRPASFASLSATDANSGAAGTTRSLANTAVSGGNVHKAGQPFTVRATAVNAGGATTANYAGTPSTAVYGCNGAACVAGWTTVAGESGSFTVSGSKTVRFGADTRWSTLVVSGTVGCNNTVFGDPALGTPKTCQVASMHGALTLVPAAAAGSINQNGSFSEAGAFTLQLIDSSFASVDASDGSTTAEMNIASSAVDIGRFVPDHFDLVSLTAPLLRTFDSSSCAARSFTYVGQPFGYVTPAQATVVARNAAGATTQDYANALWKLGASSVTQSYTTTPASPALDVSAVSAATLTSNGDGTGLLVGAAADKLRFVRPTASPLAPFNANLALAWSVQDSSEAGVSGNGSIATPTPLSFASIAFDAGTQIRFGDLRPVPAYGSVLIDLPVLLEARYWDGQRMAVNTADQCTALPAASISMGNYQRNLSACKTAIASAITLKNGRAFARLAKPGAGNSGSVDLSLQLGASASGQACSAVNGSAAAASAANLPWLQGKWSGAGAFDQNPVTRASFGQYRSPMIYQRETF